ncbi:MAG: class II glutamine amidotransferase [Bradymonadaceae bacterium]|nr:class II glutamine amidotransferase [Lujinxingiaceae bacterium]
MSQVFGYLCSDHTLTHAVMAQVNDQLNAVAIDERAGLGLGWVQEGRTLVRKHPGQRASAVELGALLADIPTRVLVGHIRHAVLGKVSSSDLQPFRFRNWVYAQRGGIEGMESLLEQFSDEIPDHIRRNLQGQTSAEIIFHLLLARLQDHGAFTSVISAHQFACVLVETMLHVEKRAKEAGVKAVSPLLAVTATERQLTAARVGEAMHYRIFEGIDEPVEKSLFAGHRPKPVQHPRFRAVIIANKIEPDGDKRWIELPDRHVLWVEPGWQVKTARFEDI